jgi:small subunit ribosomal protein S17
MDKTVVVTVIRRVRDRRFHKFVTRRVKYKAHDENNASRIGDLVEIIEARPMSATKRWRVLRTLKKAIEIVETKVDAKPEPRPRPRARRALRREPRRDPDDQHPRRGRQQRREEGPLHQGDRR